MMADHTRGRVAILYPGNLSTKRDATAGNNRFAQVFDALTRDGLDAEPAVYHDDFCDEVRRQLMQVDGVLVWMNPIQDGRDRSVLDAMLREVAARGIFVSAHPDVILKIGTKEVLYRTREMGWGGDTRLYRSMAELRRELPPRLAAGSARVLKQNRGNGGIGVWKVELASEAPRDGSRGASQLVPAALMVRARHAVRGSLEEEIPLEAFLDRCEPYFRNGGIVIDQSYQPRLTEGMIRCYLVHDRVVGFGHQAVNALYPAPPGAPRSEAPQPGPRLYHPPTVPEFQSLKRRLEREWVPALQQLLEIETFSLPVLWDCDFLLGPRDATGDDTYVLCEINVSSVAPFPDSAVPHVAAATTARVAHVRQTRGDAV